MAKAPKVFHENPGHPSRWFHRRMMAYLSLCSIIVVPFILMTGYVSDSRVAALENIVEWYFICLVTVVGAYLGFATMTDGGLKLPSFRRKDPPTEGEVQQ
jgi:uncharacterized membrane protein YbjE (DUF340 family)